MDKSLDLTCIACPLGCRIKLKVKGKKILNLEGNQCRRGEDYAQAEFTNPLRMLTTTVQIKGAHLPLLPIRTSTPLPKGMLDPALNLLAKKRVKAPVKMGDIIIKNILGSKVDIVATRDLRLKTQD
ncbi:MAG: molybdopterin oxidoreductase [Armatimonadetes bacterium CG07_land_8_20_14_0_80_40_9]|nr:MAG: molybdopterin oxidoreductase [Armatimonadetes bacterium CG07_land_8_20_14_0_80_40_9]